MHTGYAPCLHWRKQTERCQSKNALLGRTAGLSCSSDGHLLTSACSAVVSDIYHTVLVPCDKGSYQYELGEDSEGAEGKS